MAMLHLKAVRKMVNFNGREGVSSRLKKMMQSKRPLRINHQLGSCAEKGKISYEKSPDEIEIQLQKTVGSIIHPLCFGTPLTALNRTGYF
jgi:hypothetical protein